MGLAGSLNGDTVVDSTNRGFLGLRAPFLVEPAPLGVHPRELEEYDQRLRISTPRLH